MTGPPADVIFNIMMILRQKQTRTRWLNLTAILLVLYVCQIFPHEHCETGHTESSSEHHDLPVAHAHHPHSQDSETQDVASQPGPEHHHDLAQHVDSFFLRTTSHGLVFKPDFALEVVQLRPDSGENSFLTGWSENNDRAPRSTLILPIDSRGPPLHG